MERYIKSHCTIAVALCFRIKTMTNEAVRVIEEIWKENTPAKHWLNRYFPDKRSIEEKVTARVVFNRRKKESLIPLYFRAQRKGGV